MSNSFSVFLSLSQSFSVFLILSHSFSVFLCMQNIEKDWERLRKTGKEWERLRKTVKDCEGIMYLCRLGLYSFKSVFFNLVPKIGTRWHFWWLNLSIWTIKLWGIEKTPRHKILIIFCLCIVWAEKSRERRYFDYFNSDGKFPKITEDP